MNVLDKRLLDIINLYKDNSTQVIDSWVEHCQNQTELKDAILYAALAVNHLGKRNRHQTRIPQINLDIFSENLLKQIDKIKTINTFKDLFETVQACKINGIGPLAIYDTAHRIGAYLGLTPDYVYIHAGVKTGAEKLLGRKIKERYIDRSILPLPFQDPELTNAQIEDILCRYKDAFDSDQIRPVSCNPIANQVKSRACS